MADGSQRAFHLPLAGTSLLRPGEIVVDFFAGGGGASEALRQALGRDPDIAVNHDPDALGMHAANHPYTQHVPEDVWAVDILRRVDGRMIGWFHGSPDCTHFSQAKGGQPRSHATRSLSWVLVKVAGTLARRGLAPRIISLENVRQILQWCPLVAKRDKATGCVLTLDKVTDPATGRTTYRVADPGERVPVWNQQLVPDRKRIGRTWKQFVAALRALGYVVEWRLVKACDHGAGTSRERLFMIARRDGEPIVWPAPTHGPGREHPYVTAADCIDWSIPCPSIFTRKKPLAEATCRRIARGIRRYVIAAAEPFFITEHANGSHQRNMPPDEPLRTQCAGVKGGHFAVVAPTLVQASHGEGKGATKRRGSGAHDIEQPLGTVHAGGGSFALAAATLVQTGYGERAGQAARSLDIAAPLGTVVGGGQKHALASAALVKFRGVSDGTPVTDPVPTITSGAGAQRPAGAAHAMGVMAVFLEQAAGGPNSHESRNRGADEPVSTISTTGSQQRLVTASLATLRRNCNGRGADEPLGTLCAGAEHHAVVECILSPEHEAGALRVAAFLMRYHSTGGQHAELGQPITTVTTKDRLALVTVTIHGTPYVIVDIGLRMLKPPELYRAQGFPPDYIIERTAAGRRLTISQQVRMVGNSVSPPPLAAIARANLDAATAPQRMAA